MTLCVALFQLPKHSHLFGTCAELEAPSDGMSTLAGTTIIRRNKRTKHVQETPFSCVTCQKCCDRSLPELYYVA